MRLFRVILSDLAVDIYNKYYAIKKHFQLTVNTCTYAKMHLYKREAGTRL